MTMSRRMLLATIGAASASLALAACVTTTDGTATKHTISVAKVVAYTKAGLNAAAMVSSALVLVPALQQYSDPVRAIAAALQQDLATFQTVTGGQIEVVYDAGSWKTVIDSILVNLDKLLTLVQALAETITAGQVGVTEAITKKVNLVRDALNTVVTVFQALTAGFISTAATATSLSEAEALAALGQ